MTYHKPNFETFVLLLLTLPCLAATDAVKHDSRLFPLFADQLPTPSSFVLTPPGWSNGRLTLFGWMRVGRYGAADDLTLMRLTQTPPGHEGPRVGFEVRVSLRGNRLGMAVGSGLLGEVREGTEVNYTPDDWKFVAFDLDLGAGVNDFRLYEFGAAGEAREARLRIATAAGLRDPAAPLTAVFGPDVSVPSESGKKAPLGLAFKNFSVLFGPVKRHEFLYLLSQKARDTSFTDFVFYFRAASELAEFGSGSSRFNFQGELPTLDAGWPRFHRTAHLRLAEPARPVNPGFFATVAFLLEFKISADLEDGFVLATLGETAHASALTIALSRSTPAGGATNLRRFTVKFADQTAEFAAGLSISPDKNISLFIGITEAEGSLATLFVKKDQEIDFFRFKTAGVKLGRQLKLFPSEKAFVGWLELHRALIFDDPTGLLLPEFSNPDSNNHKKGNKVRSCLAFDGQRAPDSPTACFLCAEGSVLDLRDYQCIDRCPEGRKASSGLCVQCQLPGCAELAQHDFLSFTRSNATTLFVKIKDKAFASVDVEKIFARFDFHNSANLLLSLPFKLERVESLEAKVTLNIEDDIANQSLVATLTDISELADANGNTLHDMQWTIPSFKAQPPAPRLLKDAVTVTVDTKASAEAGKPVSLVARILAFITLGVFCLGLLAGLARVLMPAEHTANSFAAIKLIQALLVFQFICFWSQYRVELPSALSDYLRVLFDFSVGIQHLNWSKLSLNNNFIDNMGVGLFVQAGVTLLVALAGLLCLGSNGRSAGSGRQGKRSTAALLNRQARLKTLFIVFVGLAVQTTFFATKEFLSPALTNWFGIVSLSTAANVSAIILCLTFFALGLTLKTKQTKVTGAGTVFLTGALQTGARRIFLPLQALIFIALAAIASLSLLSSLIQVLVNYGLVVLLFGLSFVRFPQKSFWQYEQMTAVGLFWLAKTTLCGLQLGALFNILNPSFARVLGYTTVFFVSASTAWNTAILVDSLVRDIRQEKKGRLMESIFVIKTITGPEVQLGLAEPKPRASEARRRRDSQRSDRSFVSVSATDIYTPNHFSSGKGKHFGNRSSGKRHNQLAGDHGDDELLGQRLGSFKVPAKLAQLKFCNLPIGSDSANGKRESYELSQPPTCPLGSSFLIRTTGRIGPKPLSQLVFAEMATDRCSVGTYEADSGEFKDHLSTQENSSRGPADLLLAPPGSSPHPQFVMPSTKFQQILTTSRLAQLKDSVSFVKKKDGEHDHQNSDKTIRTVLPAEWTAPYHRPQTNRRGSNNCLQLSGLSRIGSLSGGEDEEEASRTLGWIKDNMRTPRGRRVLESEILEESQRATKSPRTKQP